MSTRSVCFYFALIVIMAVEQSTLADSPPYCDDGYPIIIVGSGLAGHSAAAELISILSSKNKLESHPIIMLEKEAKFGGNSMKATSGINGAGTEFQKDLDIKDDPNVFGKDTYYSALGGKSNIDDESKESGNPEMSALITTLTKSSASAVDWLKNEFDLKLTAISQCGGHSHPRTHRPPAGPAEISLLKQCIKKLRISLVIII